MRIQPIETPRLLLRSFRPEDALFAIGIWNDPEMGKYLPDEAMEEIDEDYLLMVQALGDDEECCYLIAEDRHTHARIGTCSFIPSTDGSTYDIAYSVHSSHWRQGYATEMAQGMVGFAKARGAKKVTIWVNRENAASNRVAQKLGGVVTGGRTYKKHGTDTEFHDDLYELAL